jgi:hypothetical protein
MTRAEFKRQLDRLREIITDGLVCYAAWKSLLIREESKVPWSLEEHNKVLGRFRGLLTPVGHALLNTALMQFAKVFDSRIRTASLWNLLGAARRDASLISGHTSAEVDEQRRRLRQSKKILMGLKQMRDQRLAHAQVDPAPVAPLLMRDFDDLVERVRSAFNWLSTAHDGNLVSWQGSLQDVERDTTEVLGILRGEMERKQREYQEEMERIVLEEVRRRETLVGRLLDKEEMRSLKQSFGLS